MENLLEYDGLIYSIIGKYSTHYDREDLYQVAMIGLMDAFKHYKKEYETKFSSFTYYYIVGEVNKYIRESSGFKISKDFIKIKKEILKAKDVMMQRLGREPTNTEISLFLEMDENLIDQALLIPENASSLDDVEYNCGIYDNTSAEVLDLRREIEKLPEEEKRIILARYYSGLTQSEVSKALGISQVQVSRNENKILQKLKTRL